MIIDASGLILGRLASMAATRLLAGEEIHIVNADKAIVSGRKESIFNEYGEMRRRGSRETGPYFPRRPERILKRTVRGMLPYKRKRGREAMSRLRVYVGVPREFESMEFESLPDAKVTRLVSAKYIELGELSRNLGSNF